MFNWVRVRGVFTVLSLCAMAYRNPNRNRDKFPWMGQRFRAGKKQRKCFATKKEALLWEAEELPVSATPTICLLDWATEYLRYAEKTFVKKTFEEKRFAFKRFFASSAVSPASSCASLSLSAVLAGLQCQAEERSGNAANKDRKNLSAAWVWGVKCLGLPMDNPFARVERFSSVRSPRYVPSLADFWKVYEAAQSDRDRLMLYCYLQTGARRDELFRLRWEDVDFDGLRIRLSWRKNQIGTCRFQWLPVKRDLIEWLQRFRGEAALDDFVFVGPGSMPYKFRHRWLPQLCEAAGVRPFGFHGIRHLFASLLAANNVPLPDIQFMLRHNNLTTTQGYIHRLKTENREVLEALPNLSDSR